MIRYTHAEKETHGAGGDRDDRATAIVPKTCSCLHI